ncbi:hypothetical protein V495_07844 [Pseudogymnoascus sp. VKM F-4514 (FW-929)]|nr:hypothetical protein V495_07844 [Pseudogymnoascus sp. VKM F-4514 (FW-929)]KFY58434.1 hypothetical protein V497_04841 [Pseudogymnoascus sp. VKM F-4516 (FW-969)]
MHTQEEQLAASSGGNPEIATEHINSEGIDAASPNDCVYMNPPDFILENQNPTKPTRRTQTDPHSCHLTKLRSGSVSDEYGAACEGGLYRPAQPNVVKVRNACTQTDSPDSEDNSDGDQFAILTDEEDEGVQVEEVEFASRRNSTGYGGPRGGLGVAGGDSVGGVPPTIMDVLDGINADYEIVVDTNVPNASALMGGTLRKIQTDAEMSGALMPPNGKRKVKEAQVELEEDAVGQQPAMKKTNH